MSELEQKTAELDALHAQSEFWNDDDDWFAIPEYRETMRRTIELEDWIDRQAEQLLTGQEP